MADILKLGELGEILVFDALGGQRNCPITDQYNQVMDGTDESKLSVEVKTQFPYMWYRSKTKQCTMKAFTVEVSQVRKCSNVDRLIFVEVPAYPSPTIKVYEATSRHHELYTIGSRQGAAFLDYKIMFSVDNQSLADQMRACSNSKYTG